ncbi:MAG: ATP-binding cassette domain-containing protein [Lachnospiraceae bacterium]|nr:ATP-binding cassette domain-containing protein [Lachnospiraceae bacterium]
MGDAVIEIKGLSKAFETKEQQVWALKDVNLSIHAGEIYGIIGMSGAGKSTLVRCLNYLERPTQGSVLVEGQDLSALSETELRKIRMRMGMIFQHFNLLMQRSVFGNVLFPLEISKVPAGEAKKKALELLGLVGLENKANAYPAQLSGGQMQRVAIARALAADPKILLCDEATSALDPATTKSILELLREINTRMGITIVIITHAMSVVEEVCSHVAIIDNGSLVESGLVREIFTAPKSDAARRLFLESGAGNKAVVSQLHGKRCIRIVFQENSSFEPVIANMVLTVGHPANILLADTKDIGGIARGQMVLQLPEDPGVQEKMISYLKEHKLDVQEMEPLQG